MYDFLGNPPNRAESLSFRSVLCNSSNSIANIFATFQRTPWALDLDVLVVQLVPIVLDLVE